MYQQTDIEPLLQDKEELQKKKSKEIWELKSKLRKKDMEIEVLQQEIDELRKRLSIMETHVCVVNEIVNEFYEENFIDHDQEDDHPLDDVCYFYETND
jgi:DNA repair exonuclease SbcCD ATPase subunit